MKTRKLSIVPSVCFTVIFGIAAIVLLIVGLVLMQDDMETAIIFIIMAATCFFCAIIIFISIFMVKSQRKKQEKNLSNPDSIINKVMNENNGFKHFIIIPDAQAQKTGNVAANVAGIAAFAIIGVGFVQWGKRTYTAYVSDNELIIDTVNKPTYEDSNFSCFKSEEIENMNFQSFSKYERITIMFTGERVICFDIKTEEYGKEYIHETFGKLFKKPVQSEAVFSELQSDT